MRETLVQELGEQYETDPQAEVINTTHNGGKLTIIRFDMPIREAALTKANQPQTPESVAQRTKDAVDQLRHNNIPNYIKDQMFAIATIAFPELDESDYEAVMLNSQFVHTVWKGADLVGFNTYDKYPIADGKKILYRGAAAMNPTFRGQGFGTQLYEQTFKNGVDVVATTTRSAEVIHLFSKFARQNGYLVNPIIDSGDIQPVLTDIQELGHSVLCGNNLGTASFDAPLLVRRDHMPVNQKVNLGINNFSETDHLLLLATKGNGN